MLVAGVVLGILLGPAVLGRVAPQVYTPLFVDGGQTAEVQAAQEAIRAFEGENFAHQLRIQAIIEQYAAVADAGDSAMIGRDEQIRELNDARAADRDQLDQQLEAAHALVMGRHLDKLSGMATAMLLMVVVLFAAESILSPQRDEVSAGRAELSPLLSRLVTVRYALAAGWLMVMLAQPVWLRGIDPWFGGLLLLVVLIAGLVPLGRRAEPGNTSRKTVE